MARVTVEDCLEKVSNRFALVLLVSKRTKQLMKGLSPVVSAKSNKHVVTALREVAAGKVNFELDESLGSAERQVEADIKKTLS